jgi:Tfp pilus assembly protein PilF
LVFLILPGCRQSSPPVDVRERAYRANNQGVALLERFQYAEAADAFRQALQIDGSVAIARFNLSLALLHAQDLAAATREATEADRAMPSSPQPPYLLGLLARAENRPADALREFERVRRIDPRDVGTNVNLGQVLLEERRYDEAIALLREAVSAEPFNVTAVYNLGLALTRAGQEAEGRDALARAQSLRTQGYSITFGNGYLEQGSYAEAIASTGTEPGLIDAASPRAAFTSSVVASLPGAAGGGVALIDADGDDDLDLFVAAPGGERLWENQGGGRWRDATAATTLPQNRDAVGAAAGDYDNDGRTDLVVLRREGSALYRNEGGGRFSDVTVRSRLQNIPFDPSAGAWGDVDHDGDVDLVISGQAKADGQRRARQPSAPGSSSAALLQLLRNNGDGTFADISAAAGLGVPVRALAIAPTDFDNRRDLDLLVANALGAPMLFRNLRDGRFHDVAGEIGLTGIVGAEQTSAIAVGDVNKDDFPDFLFARPSGAVFALSDGRGAFRAQPAPAPAAPPSAAQLFDYDNDGLLDLLVSSGGGTRLWRNAGREWVEVTATALSAITVGASSERGMAVADLDANGTSDVVLLTSDAVVVLTNAGDPDRRSQRVQLRGRVGNRLGLGAKVQLRAGSLSARVETSAATPMVAPADVLFGLGGRPGADAIRVLWPSGILQSEVISAPPSLPASPGPPTQPAPVIVEELDRKPSSCPFLFTWNGERFEFVTDFLGAGEMGYWQAQGVRNTPDPIEYVRIPGDQLRPRNGRLELRVTNELEEALFVDRLQLLAVAHPLTVDIYPNEGMTTPPKPFRLFQVADQRVPRAVDDHGHDVTDRIARVDRTYPDDFALERLRGYARPHTLSLDLGPVEERAGRDTLLLTAWTDYAFSSDNVAASHAGLSLTPPALDVKDSRGRWRRALDQIGIPVGRPQTIPIDLSPYLGPHEREVRIVTTMRIYWDRIAIGRSVSQPLAPMRIDAASATLRSRGFSAEQRPGGAGPLLYDYSRVSRTSPWKIMTGYYTREGDVLELVASSDDRFVIAGPGDEVAVDFPAALLGQLPDGWTRTFLLYADGFSKEMDINSATPDHVEPLPFHAMSAYPYPPTESYPDTPEHQKYRRLYNTRYLARPLPVPLLEAAW